MVTDHKKGNSVMSFFKCMLGLFCYIFVVVFLLCAIFFVIIPITFKYSDGFQKSIVFPTWLIEAQNYSDIENFGMQGVRNFYLVVDEDDNVTIGIWEILPLFVVSEYVDNDEYNFDGLLKDPPVNILIYLHGNGHDRTGSIELYKILRKYFLIIACDYRGYGDSSKAPLKKDAIVDDIVHVYEWLRNITDDNIYIWGHSLGSGVGTEVVSKLETRNHTTSGLILEAPFTSIVDVVERHPVVKFFAWLPWYRYTLIDPLIYNELNFEPAKHIVDVNCPIMILHAKDDSIVPYDMSEKLYEIATTQRNITSQGGVTFYLFDAELGYNHMYIYTAPELPFFVKKFIENVDIFNNMTKPQRGSNSGSPSIDQDLQGIDIDSQGIDLDSPGIDLDLEGVDVGDADIIITA